MGVLRAPLVGIVAGTQVTVFDAIYRENRWNGVESLSGPGSGSASTERITPKIRCLARDLRIESVLDIGCGDNFWMPMLPGYFGIDVTAEAVDRARTRHPTRLYAVDDARTTPLAAHDLVIVRDVLQHLPLADGQAILRGIRSSRSRWLLASTYLGGVNQDILAGQCYDNNLSSAPFDLGPAEELLFDGWSWDYPVRVRDERKYLGLWDLTR